MKIHVTKNFGHPWDQSRKGFDLMEVQADSHQELLEFEKLANKKFWSAWIIGNVTDSGIFQAAFYKPCGIMEAWEDDPNNPHAGIIRP